MVLPPELSVTDKLGELTGNLKNTRRDLPIGLYTKALNCSAHVQSWWHKKKNVSRSAMLKKLTYISLFCCWANADIQIFTSLKLRRGGTWLARYVCPSNIGYEFLTLHLTNMKPLGIVIGNILSLSTSKNVTLANFISNTAFSCKLTRLHHDVD